MSRLPPQHALPPDAPLPLAEPLPDGLTAVEAFQRLAELPNIVFFDSAAAPSEQARYSFVAADPFEWIESRREERDPLGRLESRLRELPAVTREDLPPFQGGAAGLLGYELGRTLESIGCAAHNDLPMPALAVGLYDVVLAFDHLTGRSWIVAQGYPESDAAARLDRARARIAQFRHWLDRPISAGNRQAGARIAGNDAPVHRASLAAQFAVDAPGVTSNMTAESYRAMVRRGIDYIYAGDVFQVNLAQRLLCEAHGLASDLYLRLRARNPAPYAGYLNLGDRQICSASPECFLRVRGRQVETRPIKGTRGRPSNAVADLFAGDELRISEKDRAENVMIVDLLRNDLSRVCVAESVHVAQLFNLESYAFVKHLASSVGGQLREDTSSFDLIRAAFRGGSITGAPKIRAMEIIAELEPTFRGPYCGSLAYHGFDGQMDASILIRTITSAGGWWQLPVGGGIVAQSDPDDEYRETWHKARGLLESIH